MLGIRGGGQHEMMAGWMGQGITLVWGGFSMNTRCVPMGTRPSLPIMLTVRTLHTQSHQRQRGAGGGGRAERFSLLAWCG